MYVSYSNYTANQFIYFRKSERCPASERRVRQELLFILDRRSQIEKFSWNGYVTRIKSSSTSPPCPLFLPGYVRKEWRTDGETVRRKFNYGTGTKNCRPAKKGVLPHVPAIRPDKRMREEKRREKKWNWGRKKTRARKGTLFLKRLHLWQRVQFYIEVSPFSTSAQALPSVNAPNGVQESFQCF